MYTSKVFLPTVTPATPQRVFKNPPSAERVERPAPERLSLLVDFLKFADEIDLLGPFESILTSAEEILKSSDTALQPEHLRSVTELPSGHALRKLIARSCVKAYIQDSIPGKVEGYEKAETPFRFKKEMAELEGFAADLFREFDSIFRTRVRPKRLCEAVDPLTGCMLYF